MSMERWYLESSFAESSLYLIWRRTVIQEGEECLQLNILFDSGGSSTYITLKLAGLDRVSDADVILQSLQSDHLPFGLLKFCFVLLLKRQIKPFKISQHEQS